MPNAAPSPTGLPLAQACFVRTVTKKKKSNQTNKKTRQTNKIKLQQLIFKFLALGGMLLFVSILGGLLGCPVPLVRVEGCRASSPRWQRAFSWRRPAAADLGAWLLFLFLFFVFFAWLLPPSQQRHTETDAAARGQGFVPDLCLAACGWWTPSLRRQGEPEYSGGGNAAHWRPRSRPALCFAPG